MSEQLFEDFAIPRRMPTAADEEAFMESLFMESLKRQLALYNTLESEPLKEIIKLNAEILRLRAWIDDNAGGTAAYDAFWKKKP